MTFLVYAVAVKARHTPLDAPACVCLCVYVCVLDGAGRVCSYDSKEMSKNIDDSIPADKKPGDEGAHPCPCAQASERET